MIRPAKKNNNSSSSLMESSAYLFPSDLELAKMTKAQG